MNTIKTISLRLVKTLAWLPVTAIFLLSFRGPSRIDPPAGTVYTVVFNTKLELKDLIRIKKESAKKGIELNYRKLEFDNNGKLKGILFAVDCKDGFKGEAGRDDVSGTGRFGFTRDFKKNSSMPFATGQLE